MKKFFILFLFSLLFSKDLSSILSKIERSNDLSLKTKRENSGVSYIFTRRDLDSLQIYHLRDLLVLIPINYKVNRYGIIDMFNPNTNIPFLSSYVRVFINDQELTSGLYGSGLAILDDIDLGWVDHIEVYTQAPAFDISTEPALVIIKLYTKTAKRDEGKNFHFALGSYKSLYSYFSLAKNLDKYSYFSYVGYDKEGSKKINNLNKNKIFKHFLYTLSTQNSNFIFDLHSENRNGLFGFSLDANPDKSYINNYLLHTGYNKRIDNFRFLISLDYSKLKNIYEENPVLFYFKKIPIQTTYITSTDYSFNTKLYYKKEFNKNIVLVGIKNRYKHFEYNHLLFNNQELPRYGHTKQNISSLFFQESYFIKENSIINLGFNYSYVYNNANVKDRKLKQFRLSHTYLKGKTSFKTTFSHIEYHIDPYLINSFFVKNGDLKDASINSIFEDIKYKSDIYRLEFLIGKFVSHNYFFPNKDGLLVNIDKRMNEVYFGFKWDYFYMPFSKFAFHLFFHNVDNVPIINNYKYYKYTIFNYNQFKKFNLFESLIIDKYSSSKYFFNLNLGAKYNYNDNLTYFIKGENLLNRAYKEQFFRINPLTFQREKSIEYEPINRRVIIGMEYLF